MEVSIFYLKPDIPTPISPPFLPSSTSSCIASVYSILRSCLPHCALQTGLCLTAHSVVWTFFGTSASSLTLPLPKVQFSHLPVQHFLTQGPLGSLPHVVDFPLQQSQMAYSFSGKARIPTSLEAGLPSLNTLKHLSNRNNLGPMARHCN